MSDFIILKHWEYDSSRHLNVNAKDPIGKLTKAKSRQEQIDLLEVSQNDAALAQSLEGVRSSSRKRSVPDYLSDASIVEKTNKTVSSKPLPSSSTKPVKSALTPTKPVRIGRKKASKDGVSSAATTASEGEESVMDLDAYTHETSNYDMNYDSEGGGAQHTFFFSFSTSQL
jgi:hypothetical protein